MAGGTSSRSEGRGAHDPRSVATRLVRRAASVVKSWSSEERDAVLFAASALFAIITVEGSNIGLYRQWGELAVGPYIAAAVLSALAARAQRRRAAATAAAAAPTGAAGTLRPARPWHWTPSRTLIFLMVLVGATLMPLSLEVLWRTSTNGTAHVQPEVAVVEQAGERVAHHQDPYRKVGPGTHVTPPPGQPAYDVYNPYLPLMSVLGLARSTHAPPRLTDARVAFSLITVIVVVAALALCRGPTGPRVLALQSMTIFPTAALPLATGGDDLPVAAFMLLGLVLLQRRRPLGAGIALGIAASMKITAWPLAAIAFLAATDRDGRRGRRPVLWLLAGMGGVMLPAILPTMVANVPAFVENVVRFPLGLAGLSSPAQSPLLGHVIVSLFPSIHRAFTITVATVGALVLGFVLLRHPPRSAGSVSRVIAWVMTFGILLAPATRVGYVLYPINFFVWAWLLDSENGVLASTREGDRSLLMHEPLAVSGRRDEPAA
jgi:fumarate reductase subunit D